MEDKKEEGEAEIQEHGPEHWFSKWERQCLAEAEQEEALAPELQDEAAAQPEHKQQKLWHLFQNSATAVAQLYKGERLGGEGGKRRGTSGPGPGAAAVRGRWAGCERGRGPTKGMWRRDGPGRARRGLPAWRLCARPWRRTGKQNGVRAAEERRPSRPPAEGSARDGGAGSRREKPAEPPLRGAGREGAGRRAELCGGEPRAGRGADGRPCRRRLPPSPGKKRPQNGEVRGRPHCAAGAAGGGTARRFPERPREPPP